jgi:5-methylcytosine-specific restriction endonuclease McrA
MTKKRKKQQTPRERWHAKLKNAASHLKLGNRKGTIQGAFWKALYPVEAPRSDQISERLSAFEWKAEENAPQCVYCGKLATDWDHFMSARAEPEPESPAIVTFTGYGSLLSNLVPACSRCNQSKRHAQWRDWLGSDAHHAFGATSAANHPERELRLAQLEAMATRERRQPIEPHKTALWSRYVQLLLEIQERLDLADEVAALIRAESAMPPSVASPRAPAGDNDGDEHQR